MCRWREALLLADNSLLSLKRVRLCLLPMLGVDLMDTALSMLRGIIVYSIIISYPVYSGKMVVGRSPTNPRSWLDSAQLWKW